MSGAVRFHARVQLVIEGVSKRYGRDFWALVGRYPRTERARGYLDGVSAAAQLPITDDLADDVVGAGSEPYSDEAS